MACKLSHSDLGSIRPIVVTAATKQELSLLVRRLDARSVGQTIGGEIFRGDIGSAPIVLAVTGIGKIPAAGSTTDLLTRFSPRLVINTGCCGAYCDSGLSIGSLACAASEILGDEGVETVVGWQPLSLVGIPSLVKNGNSYYNEFPLSKQATERAMMLAQSLGVSMRRGKFVTVSTCSGTARRGKEMIGRFAGICENMEGAAVALVALRFGVDCLEIRGVSNMVEDRNLANWNISLAVEQAQRFVCKFLEMTVTEDLHP